MRQLYVYVANESTLNGHIFKWIVLDEDDDDDDDDDDDTFIKVSKL